MPEPTTVRTHADTAPGSIAIRAEDTVWTYAELATGSPT